MTYTPTQLARITNLSRSRIYIRMREWRIRAERVSSGSGVEYLICESEALRFINLAQEVAHRNKARNKTPTKMTSREYHGNGSATDDQWKSMVESDKYLRKPITPESRMARIFQIVERIRDKQEAA